eukprot:CAMPEP_0194575510 /NCGR_PEP_ID=MMETSP0292-20121207/10973_1 /TAXON_ID=39354 /ORGANISM="Heterosigma akashiwo, Strain CCMP2393" /LENGTH=60 /DNA_ID=CAMNT_0039427327 /DNA_START=1075 /DNA_END=1257 /DNA_ORIENTATION=-
MAAWLGLKSTLTVVIPIVAHLLIIALPMAPAPPTTTAIFPFKAAVAMSILASDALISSSI